MHATATNLPKFRRKRFRVKRFFSFMSVVEHYTRQVLWTRECAKK